MAKDKRKKRDGSGPYKTSPRKVGKRKAAGQSCPRKKR